MGALLELLPEKESFLQEMNVLLPGVEVKAEPVLRHGMAGTHMRVCIHGEEEGEPQEDWGHHHGCESWAHHDCGCHHDHEHEHDHDHHHEHHHDHEHHHHHHGRSLGDIQELICGLPMSETVRRQAGEVYRRIAEAESKAHGAPVGEVHFHEVGALDAVVDVVGVCRLMELLHPDRVLASQVTVGFGTVNTAHGLLPVPAPATASILEGVPMTTGTVEAELCTPTGAALLTTFAQGFGKMPDGCIQGCGVGCGTKDFPRANCLRAFLLEEESAPEGPNDEVTELRANIDDMTGEALGFAMERLLEAGALDVSYVPIQMKKSRPGILLLCLCHREDTDRLAREILLHTTTMGVRRVDCARYALTPGGDTVETAYGTLRCKTGTGYGIEKAKPEYEDAAGLAREHKVPLSQILGSR